MPSTTRAQMEALSKAVWARRHRQSAAHSTAAKKSKMNQALRMFIDEIRRRHCDISDVKAIRVFLSELDCARLAAITVADLRSSGYNTLATALALERAEEAGVDLGKWQAADRVEQLRFVAALSRRLSRARNVINLDVRNEPLRPHILQRKKKRARR